MWRETDDLEPLSWGRNIKHVGRQSGNFFKSLTWTCLVIQQFPFLEIYPKGMRAWVLEKMCSPLFIAAMVARAKHWGQSACPCAMTIQNVVRPHNKMTLDNRKEYVTRMNSKHMTNEKMRRLNSKLVRIHYCLCSLLFENVYIIKCSL